MVALSNQGQGSPGPTLVGVLNDTDQGAQSGWVQWLMPVILWEAKMGGLLDPRGSRTA